MAAVFRGVLARKQFKKIERRRHAALLVIQKSECCFNCTNVKRAVSRTYTLTLMYST